MRRVILMVLDSFGIGAEPDAGDYHDEGSHTLEAVRSSGILHIPNLSQLGLFAIDGQREAGKGKGQGIYGRLREKSCGKDTTTGHWEIAGLVSKSPMPTFPQGFPKDLLREMEKDIGCKFLCNRPYSGTQVIGDFGEEHVRTGNPILYTSADSVLQLAAHEDVIPVEKLYEMCEKIRKICVGPYGVGRVIARPFLGTPGHYERTTRRHDFSLTPPGDTALSLLQAAGKDVISVGKIVDIFAGAGITEYSRTESNLEGIEKTLEYMAQDFQGLLFTNLVDFDMLYGHRNDVEGYAKALNAFDEKLPELMNAMREEDILLLTADHGCDPSTPSTDHSREYVPLLGVGASLPENLNLGTRETFGDIGVSLLDYLQVPGKEKLTGTSFLTGK